MDFDYYKNIANSILNADIDKAKEKLEIICNSGIFDNPDFPKTDNKLYINYVTRHLERLLYLTICEIHPKLEKLEYEKILAVTAFKNLYNPEEEYDYLKEKVDKAISNYETYFFDIKQKYPCYNVIRKWSLGHKYDVSPY
jgi:hypothetical protein